MTDIVKDIDSLVSDVDNITPANVKECLKAFSMQDIVAALKTYYCLGDAKAVLIRGMLHYFISLQRVTAEYPEDDHSMVCGNFLRSVYALRQFLAGDVNIHTNGSRAKVSINSHLVYAANHLLNGTKTKEELANWLLAIGKFIMENPLEDLQGTE